uniref:Transposon Ty3-G Gag-Pol polyprotein n=1 Tax=Cajanus cajan TaxID=3821 RepID=A0A151S830_CAJCA|nr:Transposon Ty3-G Gag-Pol polyprotein [Cajanus cajan]
MRGDALAWFKWMFYNQKLGDWLSFSRALEVRFGPSSYENPQATLFKLKQTGTVTDYQTAFEKLNNQVFGLDPAAIRNCFISGLSEDIQKELAILKPQTVSQAMGLAKLVEDKLKDVRPKPFRSHSYPSTTAPSSKIPSTNTPQISPTLAPNTLPIKRLSTQQMQERRTAGLCYNCDEKFFPGHKCSTPRFLLLLHDEAETLDPNSEPETAILPSDPPLHFHLSPQALTGLPSPQTLKFHGTINGQSVMVLIDTGSSHNIIQPRLAKHLHLSTQPTSPFKVMVGNGAHILCQDYCPQVAISFQKHTFQVPLYLLPIEGADVVLGLAWLRTLGPVQADFSIPSFTFNHHSMPITITGETLHNPTQASFHQVCQFFHQDSIASFHLLTISSVTTLPNFSTNTHPSTTDPPPNFQQALSTLLQKFSQLFQQPHGLPPSRPHDHHIPLIPSSNPVNIKPYRYPHSQKDTMTSLISSMLHDGIIKPSTSPFSSPVLLVKKKDGTWRFCVDYCNTPATRMWILSALVAALTVLLLAMARMPPQNASTQGRYPHPYIWHASFSFLTDVGLHNPPPSRESSALAGTPARVPALIPNVTPQQPACGYCPLWPQPSRFCFWKWHACHPKTRPHKEGIHTHIYGMLRSPS